MENYRTKPRKKRSIIYQSSRDSFQDTIRASNSIADVLRGLGLHVGAGNYKTIKRRIRDEAIDISHWAEPKHRPRPKPDVLLTVEQVLIENCPHGRSPVRRLIIGHKLLKEICSICGLGKVWNGKPITLRVDHINGISNDNRLSNLRFVCPNCDSQLDTYGGRNKKRVHLSSISNDELHI